MAPLGAVLFGGSSAVLIVLVLFYLLRILETQDRTRFRTMAASLPAKLAPAAEVLFSLLVRPEAAVTEKPKKIFATRD